MPRAVRIQARLEDCRLVGVYDAETGERLEFDYEVVLHSSGTAKASIGSGVPSLLCTRDAEAEGLFYACAVASGFTKVAQLGPWLGASWPVGPRPAAFRMSAATITYECMLLDFELLTVSVFVPIEEPRRSSALDARQLLAPAVAEAPGFLTPREREQLRPFAAEDEDVFLRLHDHSGSGSAAPLDKRSELKLVLLKNGGSYALLVCAQLPCATREQLWFLLAVGGKNADAALLQVWSRAEQCAVETARGALAAALRQIGSVQAGAQSVQVEGTFREVDGDVFLYSRGAAPSDPDQPTRFVQQQSSRRGGTCLVTWQARRGWVAEALGGWPCSFPEGTPASAHSEFARSHNAVVQGPTAVWDPVCESAHVPPRVDVTELRG